MAKDIIKVGRRKTSVAQAKLIPGKGEMNVNKKPLADYFKGCDRYQQMALSPLVLLKVEGKFDIKIKVEGGGVSSQAGAIRHAVARSLALMSDDNKKVMKKAGFLTRDPRMVERKKPGQPKARKKFQFSKR
ncbi:MAG: 30S ribosomal protein S9 [Elusimicrobiaceae bacterium]|jgi:small subunit ribosomal protein S9|nr:30S ribosomal protein S9 [Elusimicrobiaceae bacterium]MBT4008315.1 30S ribosomal protein S9 [Elusimicrobiaceae bacterium]MBT4440243.1 30S ribosomal protein S9 [Elusimicrobiaceae bacterium]